MKGKMLYDVITSNMQLLYKQITTGNKIFEIYFNLDGVMCFKTKEAEENAKEICINTMCKNGKSYMEAREIAYADDFCIRLRRV